MEKTKRKVAFKGKHNVSGAGVYVRLEWNLSFLIKMVENEINKKDLWDTFFTAKKRILTFFYSVFLTVLFGFKKKRSTSLHPLNENERLESWKYNMYSFCIRSLNAHEIQNIQPFLHILFVFAAILVSCVVKEVYTQSANIIFCYVASTW